MRDRAEAEVPPWAPTIVMDDGVAAGGRVAALLERAPAGYVAPPIRFGTPEPLLIAGGSFTVVSAVQGLDAASIHTLGSFDWGRAFAGIARSVSHGPSAEAPVVAANTAHANYFHWTLQTVGTALMAGGAPLILPSVDAAWQGGALAMAGAGSRIEVDRTTLGVFSAAIRTNLTGGDYATTPHPALLAAFAERGATVPPAAGPRRLYLARFDSPARRPLRNEAVVAERLAARGFTIVETGRLPLREQIGLIRSAEIVVAPHGAALTNLLYAADGDGGPRVVELLQENYPNSCFLKIAQAKRLRYAALVGRCIEPARHHHLSAWEVSPDAVERLVDTA